MQTLESAVCARFIHQKVLPLLLCTAGSFLAHTGSQVKRKKSACRLVKVVGGKADAEPCFLGGSGLANGSREDPERESGTEWKGRERDVTDTDFFRLFGARSVQRSELVSLFFFLLLSHTVEFPVDRTLRLLLLLLLCSSVLLFIPAMYYSSTADAASLPPQSSHPLLSLIIMTLISATAVAAVIGAAGGGGGGEQTRQHTASCPVLLSVLRSATTTAAAATVTVTLAFYIAHVLGQRFWNSSSNASPA